MLTETAAKPTKQKKRLCPHLLPFWQATFPNRKISPHIRLRLIPAAEESIDIALIYEPDAQRKQTAIYVNYNYIF